ncbi:MAG TPA: hypothetical protein VLI72_17690 [Methylibium sp.]|nr:hypothetical protein [Methylibium sp.]
MAITFRSDMDFSQPPMDPSGRLIASDTMSRQVIAALPAHRRREPAVRSGPLRRFDQEIHIAPAQPKLLQALSKQGHVELPQHCIPRLSNHAASYSALEYGI